MTRVGLVFSGEWLKGASEKKPETDNEVNFYFVYTNEDLQRLVKCQPIRNFINTQYLKYIAHVWRRPNTNLPKLSLFLLPKAIYYRDPWNNIAQLLGNITVDQAKRETLVSSDF